MADMERFLERVLRATEFDGSEYVWWRMAEGEDRLQIFAQCNDLFYWAVADLEEITPENVHVLEQARKDLEATGDTYAAGHTCLLFAARVRGMRPQGAYYEYFKGGAWDLFDACGPERDGGDKDDMGFGNTPKPDRPTDA